MMVVASITIKYLGATGRAESQKLELAAATRLTMIILQLFHQKLLGEALGRPPPPFRAPPGAEAPAYTMVVASTTI